MADGEVGGRVGHKKDVHKRKTKTLRYFALRRHSPPPRPRTAGSYWTFMCDTIRTSVNGKGEGGAGVVSFQNSRSSKRG